MAKKEAKLEKDGFTTVWRFSVGGVDVDVYKDEKLVLEWGYIKVSGVGRGLTAQAAFWLDQVILQAKSELEKLKSK